jgi:hypothetical protein
MDPDATLHDLLVEAKEILMGAEDLETRAQELAEHAIALHEWIVKGGYLPKAWQTKR